MRALLIVSAAVASLDTDQEEPKREKIQERSYSTNQSLEYDKDKKHKQLLSCFCIEAGCICRLYNYNTCSTFTKPVLLWFDQRLVV
jgi:hypothetical protein